MKIITKYAFIISLLACVSLGAVSALTMTPDSDTPSGAPGETGGVFTCTPLTTNFGYGAKDSTTNGQVSDLQFFLQERGYLASEPTGYFGGLTRAAVRAFQQANGITSNGVAGPMTRAKIKLLSCVNGAGETISTINTGPLVNTVPTLYACTMEARLCPDESMMPRDADCTWRPDRCPGVSNQSTQYPGTNTGTSITTGSITLDSASCVIPVGSNNCSVKLSYAVKNGVPGKTEFIVSGGFNYTLTQDTYPTTSFYNKTGETLATYTLKNNGVVLDTKTVTSKCVAGSGWNGSVCSQAAAGATGTTGTSGTPSITVLSPNGGETWTVGSVQTIGYKVENTTISTSNPVPIYVERNGTMWRICMGYANAGLCTYTVDQAMLNYFNGATTGFKIKACAGTSCTINDSSDGVISITSATEVSTSISVGNGVLSREGKKDYVYKTSSGEEHSLPCYFRPDDILGEMARLNLISTETAKNQNIRSIVIDFVTKFDGNINGPSPFGILAVNYPNMAYYCGLSSSNGTGGTATVPSGGTSSTDIYEYYKFLYLKRSTPYQASIKSFASADGSGAPLSVTTYYLSSIESVSSRDSAEWPKVISSTHPMISSVSGNSLGMEGTTGIGFRWRTPVVNTPPKSYTLSYREIDNAGQLLPEVVQLVVVAGDGQRVNVSGGIVVDSSTCTIPVGSNQCGVKLSYTVNGGVTGKTEFIVSGGFNYTLTQDSYSSGNFFNKAGENTTTYTLKNNGVVLDTKTVTSKCSTGTAWNGSVCATSSAASQVTGYLTVETPSCTIAVGQSQCGSRVSWSAVGTGGSIQMIVSGDKGYAMTYVQQTNSTTFMNRPGEGVAIYTLKNYDAVLDTKTVTSKCAVGTTWNGNVCATIVGVLGASTVCTELTRNFHRGDESLETTKLQTFLHEQGFMTDVPSGFYGDKTVEAVKAYQASRGLPQTGMVYDFTRKAITSDTCGY